MKKLFAMALVFALCLGLLAGCGSTAEDAAASASEQTQSVASEAAASEAATAPEEEAQPAEAEASAESTGITITDNRGTTGENEDTPDAEEGSAVFSDADLEVTGEYLFEDDYGDTCYFVTVKNNSGATLDISANGTAKDADGNILGAADLSMDAVGPGEESIAYFYFDSVSGVSTVEYQLGCNESYYQAVLSNITLQQTWNDTNVTVLATNDGDVSAEFVEAYALFLDAAGNVLDYDMTYLTDADSMIKPGESIAGELTYYNEDEESYDHAVVYLTGYADDFYDTAESTVTEADLEKTEYLFESDYGTIYYVIVKNNSDVTISVEGNCVAMDASGNLLDAGNMYIDVLGPGEQSMGYFWLDNCENAEAYNYQLFCTDNVYYQPVLSDIDVQATINDSNVVVTATNNGDKAAEFVEAYVLFFDAAGNVVDESEAYLTDDDYELKPGSSLSAQYTCYQTDTFDHIEVYLTGRAEED